MASLKRNPNRSASTRRHSQVATRLALFVTCCVGLFAFGTAPALAATKHATASNPTFVTVLLGKPTELGINLSTRKPAAGAIEFDVTNKGVATHSFEICTSPKTGAAYPNTCVGKTTKILAPGGKATITVTLPKGIYEYLSTVPGQANAGMKGAIGVGYKAAPATLAVPQVPAPAVTLLATTSCTAPVATTVNVNEFEYGFTLTDVNGKPLSSVPCGSVTFDMTNTGAIVHNFDISYLAGATLTGSGIGPFLEPNSSSTMTVTLDPGTYAFQCDVPEHAALGMVGSLDVTSS